MKIGLFDSGLGGLTILKAVVSSLPEYDYIFYGDTAHLPYGDKTEAEIFSFTKAAIRELFERDCALVIVACNTASAETMRRLQDEFLPSEYPERRILGVIIPTIEHLINIKAQAAILMATRRTIDSHKYEKELNNRSAHPPHLIGLPTPELVPLIESGKEDEAFNIASEKIAAVLEREGEVDTVILGCTHYTKLKEPLRVAFAGRVAFISQDEIIPERLAWYLDHHPEIETTLSRGHGRTIVLSEQRKDYDAVIAELLGGRLIE